MRVLELYSGIGGMHYAFNGKLTFTVFTKLISNFSFN